MNKTGFLAEHNAAVAPFDSVTLTAHCQIPLFHGTDALFQHQVALSLRTQTYPPGVPVVTEGETGNEIFFVVDGAVESSNNGQSPWTMGKGTFSAAEV
ncbi:hypothetical protein A4G29_14685 [Mycobacterium kansasii]|nr:hypothetical protein A4G29_14685 [Mycobacterium kansasii]